MKVGWGWPRGLLLLATLVTVGLMGLISCRTPEVELPFKIVAQGEDFGSGYSYSEVDPDLLILTAPEEIDAPGMGVQFRSALAEQLRAVDFNDNFIIIVFRGQLVLLP